MKILDAAIARYGERNQIDQAIEELNELAVALSHYRRGRAPLEEVAEEIADVEICLEQIRRICGPELGPMIEAAWSDKIRRLEVTVGDTDFPRQAVSAVGAIDADRAPRRRYPGRTGHD